MESEDGIKHIPITLEDTLPVKGTPIFHDGSIFNEDELARMPKKRKQKSQQITTNHNNF